ncbi:Alkaline ceramidase 3 [Podochytrium sp. JEL0797]|nr:Alkaline ceramidase 3 [Podochytrium sp. JEL0797]
MGHGLLPSGNEGYWGPVTSSLDWCESNYVVSAYVAEFWNTVSCIFYVVAMINGMRYLNQIGITKWRGYLAFISTGVIGVGSALFHGTMWYSAQMMDELPMVFGVCMQLYCVLLVFPSSSKHATVYALVLLFVATAISLLYLLNKDPVFHECTTSLPAIPTSNLSSPPSGAPAQSASSASLSALSCGESKTTIASCFGLGDNRWDCRGALSASFTCGGILEAR